MTREEQIRAAAIQQCLGSSNTAERKRRKWIEGAMWADAHPINHWKDAQGEDLPAPKTLNADEVIGWLNNQACQGWIEDVEVDKFVDKFKKDFEL